VIKYSAVEDVFFLEKRHIPC